jgi:hypothetical protein
VTALLTLLVPVQDPDGSAARRTRDAVLRQDFADWQLILVGPPGSGAPEAEDDPRVRHVVAPGDGVAAALDAGLAVTDGGHVGVLAEGDELEPGALAAAATLLPGSDVVYTDEQWPSTDGSGIDRKPDFLPHYLASYPYIGRLCLVAADLVREVGGFRPGFAGAEEWDLALRVAERTDRIAHAPVVAVTRLAAPAEDDATLAAGLRAVEDRVRRSGRAGIAERTSTPRGVRTWWDVAEPPLVSVIIPTAGGRRQVRGTEVVLVEHCLRSLVDRTTGGRWEIVLATSEHTPPEVLRRCEEIVGDRLVLAPVAGSFNFSTSVNEGARAARGSMLLLLNDDTEVVEPRWLERMVSVATDPAVGAVGAKLLFEDGTLQHVGVSFDDSGAPIHVLGSEPDDAGRHGGKTLDIDYTAVTGACLLTPADLFAEVGGFSTDLPLNFNDVDYCLKVRAAGRTVLCTPAAVLYHFESSTRGHASTAAEYALMERRWGLRRRMDPHVQYRSNF